MDRDTFQAHAETLRIVTFRMILALKSGYWEAFCAWLVDCSDAFQSTRTDGEFAKNSAPLYCWPAPGFEQRDPETNERLVCKVNVAMQGRIDATRLFNSRLFALLLVKANITRALWDRQVMIYHNSSLSNTSSSLSEVLNDIKTAKDSDSQQPPIGYAIIGWHVDDGTSIACDVGWHLNHLDNRVVAYLSGSIMTIYAITMTGWHGKKALGFTLTLDEQRRTVNLSAPDAVSQLAKDVLGDSVKVSPKHAMTKEFVDITSEPLPAKTDPSYESVVTERSKRRHALGVSIWLAIAYIEIMRGTNELCSNMAEPPELVGKCIRYQTMYLATHGKGLTYGPCPFGSLERPDGIDVSKPLSSPKLMFFHFFSDASLGEASSITGGIGMLAGCAILAISQRQHLKSPGSHTSEVVAAGTNVNFVIPSSGLLQEWRIRCGARVPFYLDSATTVFVAKSDTAIKKAIWVIRRAAVIEDAMVHDEIEPIHISERDMVADPFTKYLPYEVWHRHMHYALNYEGPLPAHPRA